MKVSFLNNPVAEHQGHALLRTSTQSMEKSFFGMPFYKEAMHMRNMGMSFFGMPLAETWLARYGFV